MKKIVIIHTSLVSFDKMKELFSALIPEARIFNIVDDSLLAEAMEKGKVTKAIIDRMKNHVKSAEIIGADVILSQCSSMGPAIDSLMETSNIPIVKIDQAMAEKAVDMGSKIGVVATVQSTMEPSCGLIKRVAEHKNKKIDIIEGLVEGALGILLNEGNKKRHNELVLEKIKKIEKSCDVIVLAQGSMIVLLPELKDVNTPILTSPELGVRKVRAVLELD